LSNVIKRGDSGVKLLFNIKKQDGTAFDLTGATATLTMAGGNVYTKITKPCTIDNATAGQCSCVLTDQDTAIPGKYRLEVTVEGSGKKFTTITEAELLISERL
jgi:hypothetical protein